MASTHYLFILLIHLVSLISCVDSLPTPDPSQVAPHVPARRWQRKPATPLEHKIVFACMGVLLFLGIVAWIYRNFRRAPKPADPNPDPAASVEPDKGDGDGEGPTAEGRLPAVPYVHEP